MKPINIDIPDFEAVLAVARLGSFRAAAEVLNITQPSVSSRIQHAEDVLGVRLFHRTTRKVSITEHGERLASHAERALAELRGVVMEFRDETRLKRGRVVVGATPSIAATIVPEVISRYSQRWPGVEVVLRDDFFGRALERLSSGEVDFALIPVQNAVHEFGFETIHEEELMVLAPANHPLLSRKWVNLTMVSKYPLLTMPSQSAMWGAYVESFAREKIPFAPAFTTMHMMSLVAMVKQKMGVTFVPKSLTTLFSMEGLGTVRLGREGTYRQTCIATGRGRALQPPAQSLIQAFRDDLAHSLATKRQ